MANLLTVYYLFSYLIILDSDNISELAGTSSDSTLNTETTTAAEKQDKILYYENFDLENVVSPVDADKFEELLIEYGYNKEKTEYLIDSFRNGFSIGYTGDTNVKCTAPNLTLHIGSKLELWNKVMKEVKLKRYAGPFEKIPFENYIQSPIGLLPKDNGTKTRLIFHLSYPQKGSSSVNVNTPTEMCKVKYCDFDQAIKHCIQEGQGCFIGKSDMASAFRNLGIKKIHWKFLVMKAESPIYGKTSFFIDKCLPFGASISCKHFQEFSDAISFLLMKRINKKVINYLDDFFFAALLRWACDLQVQEFIDLCNLIRFPVSLEKNILEYYTTDIPWSAHRYGSSNHCNT